jgi:hypothetical protein
MKRTPTLNENDMRPPTSLLTIVLYISEPRSSFGASSASTIHVLVSDRYQAVEIIDPATISANVEGGS